MAYKGTLIKLNNQVGNEDIDVGFENFPDDEDLAAVNNIAAPEPSAPLLPPTFATVNNTEKVGTGLLPVNNNIDNAAPEPVINSNAADEAAINNIDNAAAAEAVINNAADEAANNNIDNAGAEAVNDIVPEEQVPSGWNRRWIWTGVGAGVAAVGAFAAAPVVLAAAGFGASGVIAGSIAAGVQSGIGSVATGSVFASLQSAGVLGFAATTNAAIAAGGAATAVGTGYGGSAFYNRFFGRSQNGNNVPASSTDEENGTNNESTTDTDAPEAGANNVVLPGISTDFEPLHDESPQPLLVPVIPGNLETVNEGNGSVIVEISDNEE